MRSSLSFNIWLLLIVIFWVSTAILPAQVPAEHTNSNKEKISLAEKPKISFFYWHLNLQYVNDFQNGGVTINTDDRYTYGINAIWELNNWETFFQYRSLTDRYVSQTRIDEMQIGFRYIWGNLLDYKFWNSKPSHYNRRANALYSRLNPFYLGVTFSSSYFQAGNILGQQTQNFLHGLSSVPKVYNDYFSWMYTLALGLEFYFAYTIPLKFSQLDHGYIELGVTTNVETAIAYQETFSIGLSSKFYSGNQYLQFELYLKQLGYYNGFGLENTVESFWSDTSTAFWLAFSSRVGLYQRRVDVSLGSISNPESQDGRLEDSFGFGSLELSWSYLNQKRDFHEVDFSHSLLFGFDKENSLVVDRFAFPFRLASRIPSDISFVAVRTRSGDPRLFAGNSLARKVESAWLAMFHLRPTLNLEKFGFLEFYAGLGTGLLTLVYPSSIRELSDRNASQHWALSGQAGLRWYGLSLRRDGAVYGIEVALLSLLPIAALEDRVRFTNDWVFLTTLRPSVNILVGISVLTDW